MVHLVYCDDKEKVLEKILDGQKTMVVRGAAGRKIPHSRVFKDEILYFMKKGSKKISATGIVKLVQDFVKLAEEEIVSILEENQTKLQLSEKQKDLLRDFAKETGTEVNEQSRNFFDKVRDIFK